MTSLCSWCWLAVQLGCGGHTTSSPDSEPKAGSAGQVGGGTSGGAETSGGATFVGGAESQSGGKSIGGEGGGGVGSGGDDGGGDDGGGDDGGGGEAGAGGANVDGDACSKRHWTGTATVECAPPGKPCPGWFLPSSDVGMVQGPAQAIDGDWNSRYTSGRPQDGTEELVVSFPALVRISGLLVTAPYVGDMIAAYELEYSLDGLTFLPFAPPVAGIGADSSEIVPTPLPRQSLAVTLPLAFPPTDMTAIKIKQTGRRAYWWSILELDAVACSPL